MSIHRSTSSKTVPHMVDVKRLLASPKKELLPLLTTLEDWKEAEPQQVKISQISGAMTNLIFRCQYLPKGKFVLARIFGSSGALFERDDEQQIFAAVAHAGLGPKLLLSFGNGRLEEFLLDQSITASQMRTPPIAICIAAAMAIFNFTQLTRLPRARKVQPICWERLRCWAKAIQGLYTPQELEAEDLGDVFELIEALEKHLGAAGPTWMGFCHNDTQYGNMLLHTASELTLGAQEGALDMVDTHSAFEEQPSGRVERDGEGFRVELGSSPPSFASLLLNHGSRPAFSVEGGQSAADGTGSVWDTEKADDLEESQGGSPRKHPRGLTTFAAGVASSNASETDVTIDPRLSVRFIDYEYAGFNPVALDIANHWCEYAADYHAAQPHVLDYSKFPSNEQQKKFTLAYVRAVITLKKHKEEQGLPARADSLSHSLAVSAAIRGSCLESDVQAAENIEHIARKVQEAANAYVPISHLSWGIWGLLQARLSDVPSFDFTEYGRQRLREFRKWQPAATKKAC